MNSSDEKELTGMISHFANTVEDQYGLAGLDRVEEAIHGRRMSIQAKSMKERERALVPNPQPTD